MSRGMIALAAILGVAGCGRPQAAPDAAALYRALCATCHGETGRGDGPAAAFLFPKPRDFTLGKFKVRSTATGDLPTDEDLLATLDRGMPGSAMPSFAYLPPEERKALVGHVKTLAVLVTEDGERLNFFESRPKPRGVEVREERPATEALVRRGREVYKAQGCAVCHGETGVGDGPSVPSLRDDWGYPAPPNNFTRGLYKGGSSPRDLYLRFTTGMSGTPMPSFEAGLPEEDRWALAHYVKSLERPGHPDLSRQASGVLIRGGRLRELPANPFDAGWKEVEPVGIPLMHLWQRPGAADLLTVRAAHDGETLAVLLEWEDAAVDGSMIRPQDFPDAAAVMFSLSDPAGHFSMGEKGRPCNIWQWRMDHQLDLAKFRDVEDLYPGMASDDYPLAPGPKAHRPIDSAPSHEPLFLTGKAAGNPASQTDRVSAVQDLVAMGFGTLEPQPPAGQNVRGRGAWATGRWRVVFNRTLSSPDTADAQLRPGGRHPTGFAVWDGGGGDRDGQKAVTYWQVLELAP
jgi:mono/diheme cytochrome c family protein